MVMCRVVAEAAWQGWGGYGAGRSSSVLPGPALSFIILPRKPRGHSLSSLPLPHCMDCETETQRTKIAN